MPRSDMEEGVERLLLKPTRAKAHSATSAAKTQSRPCAPLVRMPNY
jgi:hypothetical protein